MPDELIVTSRTTGGVIMGLRHASLPIHGVQFHPESVLTEGGYRMLGNWLAVAGLPEAAETAKGLTPLVRAAASGHTRIVTVRALRLFADDRLARHDPARAALIDLHLDGEQAGR